MERVHLVDAHAVEPLVLGFEHVDSATGSPLAIGTTTSACGVTWSRTASGADGSTAAISHRLRVSQGAGEPHRIGGLSG